MRKDEHGYMVVETIGSFILFVFLMVSILSLVNIVTLQSRVHYALTQSANALSIYSYTLHVTDVAHSLMMMEEAASEVMNESQVFKNDMNAVLDGINQFSVSHIIEQGEAVTNRVIGLGEDITDNPIEVMQILLNYGLNEGRNAIFGKLVRPLVGRYLSNGNLNGNEYLRRVNVVNGLHGLDFYEFTLFDLSTIEPHSSVLIDQNGDIKLVVEYEIEYKFGALPLPFGPRLKVMQSARTKAWLGGRGDGYQYE